MRPALDDRTAHALVFRETSARLLELAAAHQDAFRAVVAGLSEGQKAFLEHVIRHGRAGGPGSVTASPGIWTSSTPMLTDRPPTSGATAARTWALRSPTGTPNRATTPISIRSASTLTPTTCRPAR